MKPRTKLEKQVTWLSSHLLPPSMEQIEEAKKALFKNRAFYTKKHGYDCLECGHRFQSFGEAVIVCPHCGKQLSVEAASHKKKESETEYFMLMQTVCHNGTEFVVQRLFELRKFMRRGKAASYCYVDVAEYFTNEEKQICLGIPLGMFGRWMYWDKLTIKKPCRYPSYYGGSYERYRFEPGHIIIESEAKTLLRNGFKNDFGNLLPQHFVNLLMCNRTFEQLYKLGGDDLARYYQDDVIRQIKIANRHHYSIADVNLWVDTIKLLRRLGMDDRNPKHICPENIYKWHQELHDRYSKIRQKQEAEARRKADIERVKREKEVAEEYVKRIARFIQLNIQDELISITPIPTVEAVHEEGNAMRHCVFSAEYYKKPYVLLLSARDHSGKRVETIEVNLDNYRVVQSRGVCNSNTEHHDRILSLMAQGMNQIREMNMKPIKAA